MKRYSWLAALAAFPLAASAEFDYNYAEAWFVNTEIDVGPFDVDGDGLGLEASIEINEDLYFLGGYTDIDYDGGIDGSRLNLGIGFHTPLSEDLDFVADFSYVSADLNVASGDEDGYELGAGIRAWVSDSIEASAALHYVDLDDSDTVLSASGYYYLNSAFAVGAGLSDDDFGTTWSFGVRGSFGPGE